jgi:SAM-dependent methyltransferase
MHRWSGISTMKTWAERAETFDKLQWVRDDDYMDHLLEACQLDPSHKVLDLGSGTGQVAQALVPHVREVIGIDISPEMVIKAKGLVPDAQFIVADARDLHMFGHNRFDCVVARMIFHHVLERLGDAVKECYRVLRPGGRLVIAEGIPPHPSLNDWFAEMMALKEERRTLRVEDLLHLLGPFHMCSASCFIQPDMSLRNWIEYGGVPEESKAALWEMHESLHPEGRALYNMEERHGDLYMDWTTCIAVGIK